MKKKTKFGLLLGAVAAATFYVVHKIAGKKPAKASPPAHVDSTSAPPVQAPAAPPHGSTVSHPNPATPADPFAPLPGQESLQGNVHFDQPGGPATTSASYVNASDGDTHTLTKQAPSDGSNDGSMPGVYFDQKG